METYGGKFWDVLLLSQYNEHWKDFFKSMIRVLPCDKCRIDSLRHFEKHELPEIANQEEKDQFLWELRYTLGGYPFRQKVKIKGYTLEGWKEQFKDMKFTQIY